MTAAGSIRAGLVPGRVFTRHICKPGEVLGEFPNQWVAGAKADMRFDRLDDGDTSALDMLGAPVCRRIPAVHISGLGIYGEKRPCMRVVEMARCRTVWPGHEHTPEDYAGCILRNQCMEDERYDDEPTFPEYVDCDGCVTSRGIYKGWREHGEECFGTGDVLSWIIKAAKKADPHSLSKEYLREKNHARAVRLVLEEMVGYGVHGTRVGDPNISVGAKLDRASRWTYQFRWSGNEREARSMADAACGVKA